MFSWDDAKSKSNRRKHGVSFESASLVFDDPLHITRQDRIVGREIRWQTVGMANGIVLLLVAHTWQHEAGEECIRIISARRATREERRIYEQGT